jgi:hypothetical protein
VAGGGSGTDEISLDETTKIDGKDDQEAFDFCYPISFAIFSFYTSLLREFITLIEE